MNRRQFLATATAGAGFLNFGKQAKNEGIGYLGGRCGCNAAYIRALTRGLEASGAN